MKVIKGDIQRLGVRKVDAKDRVRWKPMICCSRKKPKEEPKLLNDMLFAHLKPTQQTKLC